MGANSVFDVVDRRVRCDGRLPTCSNCARLKRRCQGYGLRLSWPRKDDSKRARSIQLAPGHGQSRLRPADIPLLINATNWDFKMYHLLSDLRLDGTFSGGTLSNSAVTQSQDIVGTTMTNKGTQPPAARVSFNPGNIPYRSTFHGLSSIMHLRRRLYSHIVSTTNNDQS